MMNKADEVKCKQVLYRMRQRCSDPNHEAYIYYGAKGIRVCDEWQGRQGALNFIAWAEANGYEVGLSIERINNDLNYSPSNCKWIPKNEQQRNRTNNILSESVVGKALYLKSMGYSVRVIARHLDVSLTSIRGALYNKEAYTYVAPIPCELPAHKQEPRKVRKFTEHEVKFIRESELSDYKLADMFDVSSNTITQIRKRISYND